MSDDDKLKLKDLENKWTSLSKYGTSNDKLLRNRFDFSYPNDYFINQYRGYFNPNRPYSNNLNYNYNSNYHYRYNPYSYSHNNYYSNNLPNNRPRRPSANQPSIDYIYNLYFKNMFIGERCLTPNMEAGFCRLVEDCPIRAVIQDYSTFLRYSCTVGQFE